MDGNVKKIRESNRNIKKLKKKTIPKKYHGMIDDINHLYNKISEESIGFADQGISEFSLPEMLENSPFAIKDFRSKRLLHFQECIWKLAKQWDEWVNDRRTKEGLTTGEHLFFLTYAKTSIHRTYYVKVFNAYLPPDQRLVAITIPNRRTRLYHMPILHEMGHIIGCRNRKERIQFLLEFYTLSILKELFNQSMCEYDGIPEDERSILFFENTTPIKQQRTEFAERIIVVLNNMYDELIFLLQQSIKDLEDEERKGIKYADYSVSFLREKTISFLEDARFWEKISENTIPELFSRVKESYIRIKRREKTPFLFLSDYVIDIFEEPTADCFMIKMGDLSIQQYLNMIFTEVWRTWKEKTKGIDRQKAVFLDYISTDIMRFRILAICYAMGATDIDICSFRHRFLALGEKRKNIYKARKMFLEMNKLQNEEYGEGDFKKTLLNPQEIISKYIKNYVLSHEHYKEENTIEMKDTLREIRKFKQAVFL